MSCLNYCRKTGLQRQDSNSGHLLLTRQAPLDHQVLGQKVGEDSLTGKKRSHLRGRVGSGAEEASRETHADLRSYRWPPSATIQTISTPRKEGIIVTNIKTQQSCSQLHDYSGNVEKSGRKAPLGVGALRKGLLTFANIPERFPEPPGGCGLWRPTVPCTQLVTAPGGRMGQGWVSSQPGTPTL